ncbi:MAG: eukaryotic-like serine/threonine-protein kinase [Acidobacteriota bacterium]
MGFAPGTRIGPFIIDARIGAGGMGEVYRATDSRLKRQVAIKVLPPLFAADADRLARLHRDAVLLAALIHPPLAAMSGLEDADGVKALVMELVEGIDLAERIASGPIPFDEALLIAKQIAEALEAAHERGIIHRDLKPANIKVRPDGAVKVLDFGLAKLGDDEAASRSQPGAAAVLPTITSPAMLSAVGMVLGTAAYMSPEQARGYPADKRADIWAFGVVVFEMLSGRRLFTGDTISDTLASVLKTEPDWHLLPSTLDTRLRALLRWCLEKDPKRRLRDIGDARVQIDNLLAGRADEDAPHLSAPIAPTWKRVLPWTAAGVLAVAVAAMLVLWAPRRTASAVPPFRLSTRIGADASVVFTPVDALSISPHGDVIAFVAQNAPGAAALLYVRRLTQVQATPLAGTDDAESPFFSADGQWIGYFARGMLKKVAVTGGASVALCEAPIPRGGSWDGNDSIVLLPNRTGGLVRVSAAGGTPEPVTSILLGNEELTHRWPQVLPGGKGVLFTTGSRTANATGYNDGTILAQSPSGARTVVVRGGYHGQYLPTGHVVYIHDGTLFAQPFDLDRLEPDGPAVPVLEGVISNAGTASAQFSISADGTLVYLPGPSIAGPAVPIHWMRQDGKTTPLRATRAAWDNLQFAPAGDRLAMQITDRQSDIWVYDLARDLITPVTADPADDTVPVWTPDGRQLAFASTRGGRKIANLYLQLADGTGGAERLTESPNAQRPSSWHPGGRYLAFEEVVPPGQSDVMILPMGGDVGSGGKPGKPTPFVNSAAHERQPAFSPDGRWLAFVSDQSRRDEVYVRPFPGPGGQSQISASGGMFPTWSRTRHEIFYSSGTATGAGSRQFMVVSYAVVEGSFRAQKPILWSTAPHQTRGPQRMFDLHPDGMRFAVAPLDDAEIARNVDHVSVFFNFFDELRRLAPRSR